MLYLLDANAVISLLNDPSGKLARRVRRWSPQDIGISAIVIHELFYGAFKSGRTKKNLAIVDNLQLAVLEFDKEDARAAGELRALLSASGTPIGPYDILIAGQAKSRDLTLITHNTREFGRVRGLGLRVEDWQL
jgi:tRNA(fMet)-specific endonuclease VapC